MEGLKGKVVFITGASAGIGRACAALFAREGSDLILAARRRERLLSLREELEGEYGANVLTVELDVRDREACAKAVDGLGEEWRAIDILVNNAGLSRGMEKLHEGDMDDWEEMIDTNIKGLLTMTRLVVPLMARRRRGHIINIGSIAGHEVYPGGNVYCATKHAVHALSKGLRIDLVDTPLRVTEISPGMVETEFSVVRFHGNTEKAAHVYKGLTPLTGEDIARCVVWAASQPPHVQINEIVVMPVSQAAAAIAHRRN